MTTARLEIHKFGGTSVASAERVAAAADIIRDIRTNTSVCVVSSAMAGVTQRLVDGEHGQSSAELVPWLTNLHVRTLRELGIPSEDPAHEAVSTAVEEVDLLLRSADVLKGLSPRARDRLVAAGERMAVEILAAALRMRDVPAVAVMADTFLETTDDHGEAEPLSYVEDRRTAAMLRPMINRGHVPIVTGFMGRGPDGTTRLLGRGGSDLTATLLASALHADEVTVWTDVDGVCAADPRMVPHAGRIDHLHYREAAELSFFGAKVLHPRTMIPVVAKRIPVRVRNSLEPGLPGTTIDSSIRRKGRHVKAVTAIRDLALVSVEGCGLAGVPGIAARVFDTLASHGISVTMISQASSESSICFAVRNHDVSTVERLLRHEFGTSLARGLVEDVVIRRNVGVVAAVGAGMPGQVGVTAATSSALCRAGVNILAIAQGTSELSISYAVDERDVPAAVRSIHDVTRPGTATVPVPRLNLVLLGFGRVGRRLSELIAQDGHHRICAVADRSGCILDAEGLDAERLRSLRDGKSAGRTLAQLDKASLSGNVSELVVAVHDTGFHEPVLVDCTASPEIVNVVPRALACGMDVVTANKEVLACRDADYEAIQDASQRSGCVVRGEATVGAGLPVFSTIEALDRTGDEITSIEACLSGTIEYLLGRVRAGDTLTTALSQAVALNFTEPDPREDLSGRDVMRKALILGRLSGLARSSRIVVHEPLVPVQGSGEESPLDQLLAPHEADIQQRIEQATATGHVLRYVTSIAEGKIRVGLKDVPLDTPLGRTIDGRACLVIHTRRHGDNPLAITGAGAGLGSTCNGILADLLRIADARFAQRRRP